MLKIVQATQIGKPVPIQWAADAVAAYACVGSNAWYWRMSDEYFTNSPILLVWFCASVESIWFIARLSFWYK